MIQLGIINTLKAKRRTDNGVYLEDEDGNEVLLPNAYVPEDLELETDIDVFIYTDSEDRIIATNLTPKIMLHEADVLDVKSVTFMGAFLDWGLLKDLFVPFNEQLSKMQEGGKYPVCLLEDKATKRLIGSAKLRKYLTNEDINYTIGEEVDLTILDNTDLGINVLINKKHLGLVYQNDVFVPLKMGDKLKGYIKKLREDNKIDVSLRKFGYKKIDDYTEAIIEKLKDNNGELLLSDNSSPEEITAILNMSKKTFKKALGALYKHKIIEIKPNKITLL
jgi:uncharacterized protein